MTTWTVFGVKGIFCSFRKVPGERAGKDIPESSRFRKIFQQTTLPYLMYKTIPHENKVEVYRYSRFTLVENTISNSPKVAKPTSWVVRLFWFIGISKKNPFATITNHSELCFSGKRFILLVWFKSCLHNYILLNQCLWQNMWMDKR